MYRLLENIRPDRKRAGTRQEQPPKKRQTGRGEPVEGAVEITTAHNLLGGQ